VVQVAEAPKQPEPVAAAPAPKTEPQPEVRPEPQQVVAVAADAVVAEKQPDTAPEAATPETDKPAPVAQVKQARETPQAIDLRTSRELERLLASGNNTAAEQRLTELTGTQAAPQSREIFAREMLVQGMPGRALNWLPQSVTDDYAGLRLLRARALLEQGGLNQAVATLERRLPPVADAVEYRITLATLLQQAGEAEASAGHWSELIAYDDSRGAWWLGLAIALESGGRTRSAAQAYAQAVALPDLSPSLADYAQQRLNVLQAGS
jgi:MSHA biogenesis protein MshN